MFLIKIYCENLSYQFFAKQPSTKIYEHFL